MHLDGRVPFCKECIQNLCFDSESGRINIEKFKDILRQIDKPFIDSVLQSSINQYNKTCGYKPSKENRKSIIGMYFKNIGTMSQYKHLTWIDGVGSVKKEAPKQSVDKTSTEIYCVEDPSSLGERIYSAENLDDFEVTPEMINLFGSGYFKSEYKAMWDKYEFLRSSYPDVTNLHVEALVTYVKFKVKEEQATAQGNVSVAEKWYQQAIKAAEKAKINPNQLSQSDLQGGLNSFSELFMAVEQADDLFSILPRFKQRPNDSIDFNIWCYVNYIRDMEGKPACSYEDVYKFYDEKKKEYIAQHGDPYGIFTDDNSEANREAVKRFITLPSDYDGGSEI